MRKLKPILLAAIAVAGVTACLMIRIRAQAQFAKNEALLRQEENDLAALAVEQQRTSNLLARPSVSPARDDAAELKKLENEAEALRKQTNELAKQRQQRLSAQPQEGPAPEAPYPQEYYTELNRMTAGKRNDVRALIYAFGWFAKEHEGRIPSSIDLAEIDPYLRKGQMSLTGTNEFEVVYHGSLDEISNIPPQAVALIRERQPWLAPSGKSARVYGMVGNSMPQIVESDDNFQSWEAEHVIPPPHDGK